MKVMIGVGHPKHVHFSKYILDNLVKNGHEVKIVARGKDVTLQLLDAFGFDYEIVGMNYNSLIKKAFGLLETDIKVLNVALRFKPDILVGGSPYLEHIGRLIRKPHISFTDTEYARLANSLSSPFTDVIFTPDCFKGKMDSKKHIKYNGYEELAYLHPNHFKPDQDILDKLGLDKNDKFIIMRLISWGASHDSNQSGIHDNMKIKYVSELEKYARVFVSSENNLGVEFEKYKLKIRPENFHSLLSYAQLYIGEGGSTATEAALLGTPSIHISTTAKFCGVYEDLLKYKLVYTFDDDSKALEKAIEILNDSKSKDKWIRRRDNMLKEKIDVTKFVTEFIEGYPESFYRIKKV